MKKEIISRSLPETQTFARTFLDSISQTDKAVIVCLYGNLGAGKTALTQAFARELGVKENITSPTFVIEKLYETTHPFFKRLIHVDAYRLSGGVELQVLNFEELVVNRNNLIVIEWPENVNEILPENHLKIYCEFVDETTRSFRVE